MKNKVLVTIGAGLCLSVLVMQSANFGSERPAQNPAKRVCVVAVHDSSLFTLCPPEVRTALANGDFRRSTNFERYWIELEPEGMLEIVRFPKPFALVRQDINIPPPFVPDTAGILDRSRPDWQQLGRIAPGVCPSGWVDPEMRKEIEAEFQSKKKEYELVDSPEQSDVVLLVEGLYISYWDSIVGAMQHNGVDFFLPGRQLRQVAIAIAVPPEVYRRDPADPEALLRSSAWAGSSVWMGPNLSSIWIRPVGDAYLSRQSASIKELMSQFFKRAKWNADIPPICPAWSVRRKDVVNPDSGKGTIVRRDLGQTPLSTSEQTKSVAAENAIRAETVLVSVPLVASDADGRYISGLTAEDFRLFEDGIEQKIDRLIDESTPIHTALIMDNSYSTAFVRTDIESAALKLLEALRPDNELMALSISNVISIDSEFTRDRSRLQSAITHSAAHAATRYKLVASRLYDGIDLTATERLNDITRRKAIMVFTDGVDIGSRLATALSTLARIEESGILVYVVKYDFQIPKAGYSDVNAAAVAAATRGAQYLQDLAARSGGRVFNASKGADLAVAFSSIAEELSHQYTICYYPAGPLKDGSFHRIRVTVDKPGIKVRARPGYRAMTEARKNS